MSDTREGFLAGRPVELRVVSFGVAFAANKAMQDTGDSFLASLVILSASAHWADTGERVFADDRAVMAWPMVDSEDIFELATLAGEVNRPKRNRAPNGQDGDAVAVPSH